MRGTDSVVDRELLLRFAQGGLLALNDWDAGRPPRRGLAKGTAAEMAFLRGYRMTWAELRPRGLAVA